MAEKAVKDATQRLRDDDITCQRCIAAAETMKSRLSLDSIEKDAGENFVECLSFTDSRRTGCIAKLEQAIDKELYLLNHEPREFCVREKACPEEARLLFQF